jgi:hypothetical protein
MGNYFPAPDLQLLAFADSEWPRSHLGCGA